MKFEEKIYQFRTYHEDLVDLIGELLEEKFPNQEDFDLAWSYFRSYQEQGNERMGSLTLKKICVYLEKEKSRKTFLNFGD